MKYLILVFTWTLCCESAAARYVWTDKPALLVSTNDIEDGDTLELACTLPIDYRGGECRLYRGDSRVPFRVLTASDYVCVFRLTSSVLLGPAPVGSQLSLRCDYRLQEYTSVSSDGVAVVVWGSGPAPRLSAGPGLLSPEDVAEVRCRPPVRPVYECEFYRDEWRIAEGACRRNLTGAQLAVWEKPATWLPVNLTCRYRARRDLQFRSRASDAVLLFVVGKMFWESHPVDFGAFSAHSLLIFGTSLLPFLDQFLMTLGKLTASSRFVGHFLDTFGHSASLPVYFRTFPGVHFGSGNNICHIHDRKIYLLQHLPPKELS
ncbi:uncharacterized protein LOC130918460 isoform X2 [Corythoichthys intestinalis]|uniref:uncharacterized protein LOC130918460 isoform X2 n=1 Tax=Corythoichthys intestinalis TaxID=161448 RepID=UPI0025A623FB|nr:uncharacterized protein LOC130918460 isoform X2 [Corythoichthys intestinalis]